MNQNDPTQKLQSLLSWLDLTIPTLKLQNPGAAIKICIAAYNEDGSGQIGPSWDEGEFQEDLRAVLAPAPGSLQAAKDVIDSHPLSVEDPVNQDFILTQLRALKGNPDSTLAEYERFVELMFMDPEERFLSLTSEERLQQAISAGEPMAGDPTRWAEE
jgi:hypothetical protein